MASVDDSSIDNDSNDGFISTKDIKYNRYGTQIHPELDTRYARSKTSDLIKQTQNERKGKELSEKSTGKVLHRVFKAVVNELNNTLPHLG